MEYTFNEFRQAVSPQGDKFPYDRLVRDYRCAKCGKLLKSIYDASDARFDVADHWGVRCSDDVCRSVDFIHEYEVEKLRNEQILLADAIINSEFAPQELKDLIKKNKGV